jgi:hypothetical protein
MVSTTVSFFISLVLLERVGAKFALYRGGRESVENGRFHNLTRWFSIQRKLNPIAAATALA